LDGLRLLRDRGPSSIAIAAGEYGYEATYFRRMLTKGAVDVLQADATRCCGITGFLHVEALCRAECLPLSAHTAPALHAHLGCALSWVCHVEYFHDHVRAESLLFRNLPKLVDGSLLPDRGLPGHGIKLREDEAVAAFEVFSQEVR
ncbi:MAG: hypothetical protein KDD69_16475, partial [Bdellovibrionales bacterium]|nr:hypothetical protein [Bdellovibrionales bacterium]